MVARAFEHSHAVRVIMPQPRSFDDCRLDAWTASEIGIATSEARRPGDHWLDLIPRADRQHTGA